MSRESWVLPGDDLSFFDSSQPWPDQHFVDTKGDTFVVPARSNYQFGNRGVPAANFREPLIDEVSGNNPVTILSGDTGTGKTTQSVQMMLEADIAPLILQGQPRIPLARQACRRVRQEMAYANGEQGSADHLVGYTTGYDSDLHEDNRIIVATNGKLLRMLIHDPEKYKGAIFMMDEFHLRETESDIIVGLCAKMGIKMVLSSATFDEQRLASMMKDKHGNPAPIVKIAMRQHDITEIPADTLVDDVAAYASTRDSIIFMPGRPTIQKHIGKVARKMSRRTNVMELHGEQTKVQQDAVFDTSYGVRTIFSTSVGEMGMTFDVDVSINPGYERAPILLEGVPTLTERPASQAKNQQRAGRAGRTRPGWVIYGSKMDGYPKLPPLSQLPEYDAPDIQTQRIDKELLLLAKLGESFDTLPLPSFPSDEEVQRAYTRLKRYGAFDEDGRRTEIGDKMASLPVDPNFARSFVESESYIDTIPNLRAQMAALVAVQQAQGIVSNIKGSDGWKNVVAGDSLSDPIHALNVFVWATTTNQSDEILRRKGIVEPKLLRARSTFLEICNREGIDPNGLVMATKDEEKEAIVACLIKGAEEVFVRCGKENYLDVRGKRRIMQRDSVAGKSKIIIGSPWNLQSYHGEVLSTREYITSPTVVTREQLEKHAPERCTYAMDGYAMDEWGNVTARKALYFDGMYIDSSGVTEATQSQELRDYLVTSLFNKTLIRKRDLPQNISSFCKQVAEVRYLENKIDFNLEIEKRLAELERRIMREVPEGVVTFSQLEAYIDPMRVASVIGADEYENIQHISPDTVKLKAGDETIEVPVEYHKNQVRICVTMEQLNYLPENFSEFGEGRDIKIKIDGRSRLFGIEEAFDRAQYPARAHWRNTPSDMRPDTVRMAQDGPKDSDQTTVLMDDQTIPSFRRRHRHQTY